ncbi:PilN domain-containing protein [Anaerophilus nitritogenes]|uniref:PilN domain-containing protein n=1 Tax=Anaerophilus nitritogenes TaxID=2498136 RepID=UPI0013EC8657|nr:PilN domain-containing protein [Anaerophilus nitritogenes]
MNNFNFFNVHLHDKKIKNISKLIRYIIIMIFIFAFLVIPFLNFFHIKKINYQIDIVNKENSNLSYDKIKDIQNKKESISKMKNYINELDNLNLYIRDKDIINDYLLNTLKNMTPNNLFFQTIQINFKEIKIRGFATTQIAIAQFQHNLECTNCFEEIFISNIEKKENYEFTLIFCIKEF